VRSPDHAILRQLRKLVFALEQPRTCPLALLNSLSSAKTLENPRKQPSPRL
jgi:hypothetical protein